MTGLVVFVTVMAVATYGIGVILAFAFASGERMAAKDSLEIYDVRAQRADAWDWQLKRAREARESHVHGCRMQLRAPLWPLDGARWIKAQVLTALEEQGRES